MNYCCFQLVPLPLDKKRLLFMLRWASHLTKAVPFANNHNALKWIAWVVFLRGTL